MPQFNIPRIREFCGWMCHEWCNKKAQKGFPSALSVICREECYFLLNSFAFATAGMM
jgi:hypothetical protein